MSEQAVKFPTIRKIEVDYQHSTLHWLGGVGTLDDSKQCYFCRDYIPAGCLLYFSYNEAQQVLEVACQYCTSRTDGVAAMLTKYRCSSTGPCNV